MPFTFQRLTIPDVILVQAKRFADERGFFMETYHESAFVENGIPYPFVQENFSYSIRGVLRGLHYQNPPYAQGKLVRAIEGMIFDVAVDLREGSPTYAQWVSAVLTAENGHMLWVPPGFAHGFCVLGERAAISYKQTAEYAPKAERGIRWDDPDIGIAWLITDPVLSPKDLSLPLLRDVGSTFV